MTTTDEALTEQIAQAIYEAAWRDGTRLQDQLDYHQELYRSKAAAVLPIIAEEVRKAKAEALREAARGIDLDEVAEEWSQGPGNRNDMHWAAANAASSVVLALHDRATEYETEETP